MTAQAQSRAESTAPRGAIRPFRNTHQIGLTSWHADRHRAPAMRLELTRRSEYAIRACLLLAAGARPVSSRELAEATGVPERFLARVLVELARTGLIEGHLGRAGGYRLRRTPATLTLLDFVEAIEGPSKSTRCVLHQRACDPDRPCAIHPVWTSAQAGLVGVLAATTIADLAAREGSIHPAAATTPHYERNVR